MHGELHEKARRLWDRSLAEGLAREEELWLDGHEAECAECREYGELSQRAIQALDSLSFEVDGAAAARVESVVRQRAMEMKSVEDRRARVGAAAAIVLTIAGTRLAWPAAAWLAGQWHLPAPAWEMAFGTFWLAPSVLFGLVMLFRERLTGETI